MNTVRRLLRQGVLPGRKVGKEWRIRKPDLDAYLRGGEPNGSRHRLVGWAELNRLIASLPGEKLPVARRLLLELQDADDKELKPEERAALERGLEDIKAGRTRPWAEVRRELE
ncbi:MAG: helix-turn-helix domain-containing protein [Firmicutes bacterium]|nr:helix-turn-helix domain-containing protein [Bacillota bacterium]